MTAFVDRHAFKIALLVLAAFAAVEICLSLSIPLGESPDEGAHFSYIQFTARRGHLPRSQAERDEAGYRSDFPGLYQVLAAPVLRRFDQTDGPQSLRGMGANPRRLLPWDGYAGMVALHTDDELPPYRGIFLSWRVTRLLSVLFSVGALGLLFLILRRYFSAALSLAGLALAAFIPQFMAVSAVLNDDSLLGLLVALFLWLLCPLFEREAGWRRYLALGLVAGLALVTKYSALFLSADLILLAVLFRRRLSLPRLAAFAAGGLAGAGWWFAFSISHFNQIESLGWFKGVLAPFLTGSGADASTLRAASLLGFQGSGGALTLPRLADWPVWAGRFFVTLWYPVEVSAWAWLSLAALAVAVAALIGRRLRADGAEAQRLAFFAGHSLLFLPLPVLRFLLNQNLAETAQGRHLLFPALVSLAYLLLAAVKSLPRRWTSAILGGSAIFLLAGLVGVWSQITLADRPFLPVKTDDRPAPTAPIGLSYGREIRLVGLGVAAAGPGQGLPLILYWQALKTPAADYTVRVTALDEQGRPIGVWRGQPVNGRYPTRAWEPGDSVTDRIEIPLLPGGMPRRVEVQILDAQGQPLPADDGGPVTAQADVPPVTITGNAPGRVTVAPRGDRLSPADPYRYRATIAFLMPLPADGQAPVLRGPAGQSYAPVETLVGAGAQIALFQVDWRWPSGRYDLVGANGSVLAPGIIRAQLNSRTAENPPVSRPLNANFANQFLLLGYDLPVNRANPGGQLEVTLYWQCLRLATDHYRVFNHLLDAGYVQRGGRDRIPQNFYSTILWQPGEVVTDRYTVPVDASAPFGVYRLDVGLYPAAEPDAPPLTLVAGGQPQTANSVALGPIKIGGPPAEAVPPGPPQTARADQFGSAIKLAGYSVTRSADGQAVALDLHWQAIASPGQDYTLFIHVLDAAGNVVAQADAPPAYPTSLWSAGETVFDSRALPPPETGRIRLGWYDPVSGIRLPVAGQPDGYVELVY